jgi:hypothetical protein
MRVAMEDREEADELHGERDWHGDAERQHVPKRDH